MPVLEFLQNLPQFMLRGWLCDGLSSVGPVIAVIGGDKGKRILVFDTL